MYSVRHDWTKEEIQELYDKPLLELISLAAGVHERFHDRNEVQMCSLVSVKTGGCQEDCKYCAQSMYYKTAVKPEKMMQLEDVVEAARLAKERGVTRMCLGAAWREIKDGKAFEDILEMVRTLTGMGVEVCTTLGMLQDHHAKALAEAGLYAYNHNVDSSREYYPQVTTTRTYDDRLETLDRIEKAGISVCCGGILGLGENEADRVSMIHTLATRDHHPESVPINQLVQVPGTPGEHLPGSNAWELMRTIAIARITMPEAMVRLSAGRKNLTFEQQALCFMAGANSIHVGERLLTVANAPYDEDQKLFDILGLKKRVPFKEKKHECCAH